MCARGIAVCLLLIVCTVPSSLALQAIRGWTEELPTAHHDCGQCLSAVSLVEQALGGDSVDAAVKFLSASLCPKERQQDGNSLQCQALVSGLLPVAARWFKASSRAQLCAGACGEQPLASLYWSSKPLEQLPSHAHSSPTCSLCTHLVNRIKASVTTSAGQTPAFALPAKPTPRAQESLQLCGALPEELSPACLEMLGSYEPLLSLLFPSSSGDAQGMCGLMGLCMEQLLAARPRPAPLPSGVAAPLAWLHAAMAEAAEEGNDSCDICKMSVIEAHSLVTNPAIQSSIVNYTKALCVVFGDPYTQTCEQYVDTYSPAVFDLLEKYLQTDDICLQLGLCPAKRAGLTTKSQRDLRSRGVLRTRRAIQLESRARRQLNERSL